MASFLRGTGKKKEKKDDDSPSSYGLEFGISSPNTGQTALSSTPPSNSSSSSSGASIRLTQTESYGKRRSSTSFQKKKSMGTMVYLPVKVLQDQLESFLPLHNQMTRAIHSHEMSVVDGTCMADKLRDYGDKQQNPKMAMLFKKVSEWENNIENLRSEFVNSMSVRMCDPLHSNFAVLRKQSKLYEKAKSAFEAADLRLKQYNARGSKLNLVRHVELEQEVDQRSRELLLRVQEMSMLKEEFDKMCMDKLLGYLENWEQFLTAGQKFMSELSPFIERYRFETAQFGKDLETYQKVKLRDLNPSGSLPERNDAAKAAAPQIGVVDDDYLFAIKDSALGFIPGTLSPSSPSSASPPLSPLLLSPASSPPVTSPAASPRKEFSIGESGLNSNDRGESLPNMYILSSASSNRAGGTPSAWEQEATPALVKSSKRLSVRYYRPSLQTAGLNTSPNAVPRKSVFEDEEDDDNWDEGPWEMRHSKSRIFGDIPNVFDVKKMTRMGKGRSMTVVVNVESGVFICRKKNSAKETIRSATALLQVIRSKKRDRRIRMIWFLPGTEEKTAKGLSSDVFEETFFLASKLQRERFYEVISWAPIVGTMNEGEGKRVFLTTEEVSVFMGSWNVNSGPLGGNKMPDSLHPFLPKIGRPNDIIVIGLQDCTSDSWFDAVQHHLGTTYIKLVSKALGHLRMAVFILRKHFHKISYYQTAAGARAISISLFFNETSLCFVNCRFADQDTRYERNRVWRSIVNDMPLKNNYFDITNQFHHQFVFGDFGYKIEASKDTIADLVAKKDWRSLQAYDELEQERRAGNVFFGYQEPMLTSSPNYPLTPGTRNYNYDIAKPMWSDRVVYKSLPGLTNSIKCTIYEHDEEETTFEHSPVNAAFTVNTLLPNMPHQEVPCQIVISRVYVTMKSIQQVSDKHTQGNRFVEFSNPEFIEKSVCSPALNQTIIDTNENKQILLGKKEDKIVLTPYTTNQQFLVNQHIFVALTASDMPQAAQGVLSIREASNVIGSAVKFSVDLSINNKFISTLSGKICISYEPASTTVKMKTEPLLKENETFLNNLLKILSNPITLKIFHDYMKSQMAEESLDFWISVQKLKQIEDNTKRGAEAVAIFKKYFSGSGMYELHIESEMKKDLQDKLDSDASDPNIFEDAIFEVLREVSENSLRKFLQTDQGQSLPVVHALYYT